MQTIETDLPRANPSKANFSKANLSKTNLSKVMPSIIPDAASEMTDDECLIRLAQTVRDHDSEHLDELARLIGRLAVTIE